MPFDTIKPPVTMWSGAELRMLRNAIVCAWSRQGRILYVGSSTNGLGRFSYHNIIGRVEKLLPPDDILIWSFPNIKEAKIFEEQLIIHSNPKYNLLKETKEKNIIICLGCGVVFTQKRFWQKFCSNNCRINSTMNL